MANSIKVQIIKTVYWWLRSSFFIVRNTLRWFKNYYLHLLSIFWLTAVFSLYGPTDVLSDLGLLKYQDSFRVYAGILIVVCSAVFITHGVVRFYSFLIKLGETLSKFWLILSVTAKVTEQIQDLSTTQRAIILSFDGERSRFLTQNGHLDILETSGIVISTGRATAYGEHEYIISAMAWGLLKKTDLIPEI